MARGYPPRYHAAFRAGHEWTKGSDGLTNGKEDPLLKGNETKKSRQKALNISAVIVDCIVDGSETFVGALRSLSRIRIGVVRSLRARGTTVEQWTGTQTRRAVSSAE